MKQGNCFKLQLGTHQIPIQSQKMKKLDSQQNLTRSMNSSWLDILGIQIRREDLDGQSLGIFLSKRGGLKFIVAREAYRFL